ncbi:type II toxin-antitoxin system PemK/MazF family toxin [Thalassobacterium maritimum]|uniref:type II toxin-antitoxin system PemK/MazF family toxin n=1 Tax=Thalassobacterium maritimum TaxID=3041265 RepID=UPI0031F2F7E7
MISEGDILLFRFPQSDLGVGKLRPALLIKRIYGDFDDCLVCMISTQTRHQIPELEIVLSEMSPDFEKTGLKKESLVRTSRLAVVQESIFSGKLGTLPAELFRDIRIRLADWIRSEESIKSR